MRFLNFVTSYNRPLKCTFSEVAFNPTIDSGFFVDGKDLYPKEYKVSLNLIVSNENDKNNQPPGWDDATMKWLQRDEKYGFPYNVGPEKPDPILSIPGNKPPDSVSTTSVPPPPNPFGGSTAPVNTTNPSANNAVLNQQQQAAILKAWGGGTP